MSPRPAERRPEPPLDPVEWRTHLATTTAEAARRRAARATDRRERAARRKAGMVTRHAWRQTQLDARAAERP